MALTFSPLRPYFRPYTPAAGRERLIATYSNVSVVAFELDCVAEVHNARRFGRVGLCQLILRRWFIPLTMRATYVDTSLIPGH